MILFTRFGWYYIYYASPCPVGLAVRMSASYMVGHGLVSRPGHTKDHHKNGTDSLLALQACVRVAARISKKLGSVWNCLWGHALKISPGINRTSRVLYPGPRFLSSATWSSLPKKHYNGLINYICIKKLGILQFRLIRFCAGLPCHRSVFIVRWIMICRSYHVSHCMSPLGNTC